MTQEEPAGLGVTYTGTLKVSPNFDALIMAGKSLGKDSSISSRLPTRASELVDVL